MSIRIDVIDGRIDGVNISIEATRLLNITLMRVLLYESPICAIVLPAAVLHCRSDRGLPSREPAPCAETLVGGCGRGHLPKRAVGTAIRELAGLVGGSGDRAEGVVGVVAVGVVALPLAQQLVGAGAEDADVAVASAEDGVAARGVDRLLVAG